MRELRGLKATSSDRSALPAEIHRATRAYAGPRESRLYPVPRSSAPGRRTHRAVGGQTQGCLHVLERGPPIRIVAGIYLDAIAIGIFVDIRSLVHAVVHRGVVKRMPRAHAFPARVLSLDELKQILIHLGLVCGTHSVRSTLVNLESGIPD